MRAQWVTELQLHEDICRRAPSAHNTQPWTLRYGDDAVELGWDAARELPAGDPTGRDLFLSLGAFVETCLVVAARLDLPVRYEEDVDVAGRRLGRLLVGERIHPTPYAIATVQRRAVARGPYRPGPLAAEELAAARAALAEPEAVGSAAVASEVVGSDVVGAEVVGSDVVGAEVATALVELPAADLAGQLRRADRWLFGTPEVSAELRDWLRLTPRHPRYDRDGLSDRALLLGRGDRLGLRMLLAGPMRGVAGRLGLARLAAASQRGLLDGDGSVLVLLGGAGAGIGDRVGAGGGPDVGRSQSPRELMAAGRALMRCWYALAELDVSVHPLSQLLDCPVTAPQIAARAGAAGSQVLAVFRAGHAEGAVPRSARIPSGI